MMTLITAAKETTSPSSSETQGQLVGTGKSLKRAKKNSGEEKSRLFPVPTNCPWVSEDASPSAYNFLARKDWERVISLALISTQLELGLTFLRISSSNSRVRK